MWVKICANTNVEDALAAVELGADAVGFVFAASKRQVNAAQVRAIADALPDGVERVGVFADWEAPAIAAAAVEARLTAVQLHGGVDLELASELRQRLGKGVQLIHTVHWRVGEDDTSETAVRAQLATLAAGERVLIDAKVGAASGGLGVRFDWERARSVLAEFPGLRAIVAGGLRPENVAQAIRTFRPYGVDVASGVESAPGEKDQGKLRAFMENARRAY
jgi:phosphoribosylanthranilate isomerase